MQYLVENVLVNKIIVVDKAMPQTSWFNHKHAAVFEDALVEYRSANLISMTSCERAFQGTEDFEFVINLVSFRYGLYVTGKSSRKRVKQKNSALLIPLLC